MDDDDYDRLIAPMHAADRPKEPPFGHIQWKGTAVCADLLCICGANGHVDVEFFYFYECFKCGKKYAVGSIVKLIPLNDEQSQYVEAETVGFKRDGRPPGWEALFVDGEE